MAFSNATFPSLCSAKCASVFPLLLISSAASQKRHSEPIMRNVESQVRWRITFFSTPDRFVAGGSTPSYSGPESRTPYPGQSPSYQQQQHYSPAPSPAPYHYVTDQQQTASAAPQPSHMSFGSQQSPAQGAYSPAPSVPAPSHYAPNHRHAGELTNNTILKIIF
jgi:hypothetical protein